MILEDLSDSDFNILGYKIPTHFVVLRIWTFLHCSIDQLGFFLNGLGFVESISIESSRGPDHSGTNLQPVILGRPLPDLLFWDIA